MDLVLEAELHIFGLFLIIFENTSACDYLVSGQLKKSHDLDEFCTKPAICSSYTCQRIPCFDSCQLSTKWISNLKVNQDDCRQQFVHLVDVIAREPCL